MKVITGNALRNGHVIYLGVDDKFVSAFVDALLFATEEAALEALATARQRVTEIADLYIIEADRDIRPAGREALKETIRSKGPTTHPHFGKQAGSQEILS